MHSPPMLDNDTQTSTATPLLFARVLDGNGGGRLISWEELQGWTPAAQGEVLWMHLCRNQPGVYEWLQELLSIPEPTAELLTSD